MKSKTSKTVMIGLLAVLVLAIGAVGVFAQAGTETPVVPQDGTTVPSVPGFHGRGGFDHPRHGRRQ